MGKGKKYIQKRNSARELRVSMEADAMLCGEFLWKAHAIYAGAAVRLGRIAHNEQHLAELLDALDYRIACRRLPFNERGKGLLKRHGRGPLPRVD